LLVKVIEPEKYQQIKDCNNIGYPKFNFYPHKNTAKFFVSLKVLRSNHSIRCKARLYVKIVHNNGVVKA